MKNTYTVNKSKTRMQLFYEGYGTEQGHEQGEALQPSIALSCTVTYTILLAGDTAPQHSFK